ncbi:hypothetical protein BH23VER1_BH23VER1_33980 [soil metagenome]
MRSPLFLATLLTLAAAGCSPAAPPTEPIPLLETDSLGKWKEIEAFASYGEVSVTDGVLEIGMGEPFTGVVWSDVDPYTLPLIDYEIAFQARRVDGTDFFAALTFPVGDLKTSCSLIVGGWGGGLVGISSIDGNDASENETASYHRFEDNVWYKIRLQVQKDRFRAWIGDKIVINAITKGRKLSLRFGDIEHCAPLGFATYQTRGQIKDLTIRKLKPDEIVATPEDY